MNSIIKYIKAQPFSVVLITSIWILCMIPGEDIPATDFQMADKWAHFLMYGTLTICIIYEYAKRHKKICFRRLFVGGILLPIIMGGLVEVAQAYLTGGTRSGDWWDFLANTIGVLLGALIGIPLARYFSTRCKGE